jgi:predicted metalloprotease with PDZ domain
MGKTVDAYFSLGLLMKDDGTIGEVRFFSPAFDAKLSPGEKIVTINGRAFSPATLQQALTEKKVRIHLVGCRQAYIHERSEWECRTGSLRYLSRG